MKNKCEEKFTHLFYLYESWCGSSGGRTGRTFADKFYTGMVSHLNGQRRSSLGPNNVGHSEAHKADFWQLEEPSISSHACNVCICLTLRFPQSPRPNKNPWFCTVIFKDLLLAWEQSFLNHRGPASHQLEDLSCVRDRKSESHATNRIPLSVTLILCRCLVYHQPNASGISLFCGLQGKCGVFPFLSFSLRGGTSPEIMGEKILEKLNTWLTLSFMFNNKENHEINPSPREHGWQQWEVNLQTCMSPLVSFELVWTRKPSLTVLEVTLVWFLTLGKTHILFENDTGKGDLVKGNLSY